MSKLIIFLLTFNFSYSSMFGEENAALYQILASSIQQLNELEKLVSSSEKYTKTAKSISRIVNQRMRQVNGVLRSAELIRDTFKDSPESLRDLNQKIKRIKSLKKNIEKKIESHTNLIGEIKIKEESIILRKNEDLREYESVLNTQGAVYGDHKDAAVDSARTLSGLRKDLIDLKMRTDEQTSALLKVVDLLNDREKRELETKKRNSPNGEKSEGVEH